MKLTRTLVSYLESSFRKHVTFVAVLGMATTVVDFLTVTLIYPFLQALTGGQSSALDHSPIGVLLPHLRQLDTSTQIRLLALLLLAIHLLKTSLVYATARVTHGLKVSLESQYQRLVFRRLMSADFAYLDRSKSSELFTLFSVYTSHSAGFLFGIVNAIPSTFVFLLFFVVVLFVSWKLTILAVFLMLLSNLVTKKFIVSVQRITKQTNLAHSDLTHCALETLNAMRLIRQFSRETFTFSRFSAISRHYFDTSKARANLDALHQPMPSTISTISLVVILLAGTYFFSVNGHIWSELILLYMYAMARLAGPVSALNRIRTELASRLHGAETIVNFLNDTKAPTIEDGATVCSGLAQEIGFQNVYFRYQGGSDYVLNNFNARIRKGETTALVGPSGSGKSTLLSLLMRFYDPEAGLILVDGVGLREFNISSWRSNIGVVSQSTFLFNDTIASNIRFGKPEASDEEVVWAAQQANAHDFIMSLPEGYQALCGDRGIRLSGGQAQRISIARALLANPQILLLDEATSSLDSESERAVQDALSRLCTDRTVIVVAHRLSTVRNAHSILVLLNGKVVEQGTHTELMERESYYHRLVGLQHLLEDS